MPELPEVETVRRGLQPVLEYRRIARVECHRAGLRTPFAADFTRRLAGARVTGLRRRAKYILADLDSGDVWLTHLGMSGSFRTVAAKGRYARQAHDHVVLTLDDGVRLVFNDPRRFGQMAVFARADEATQPALSRLGPEPLDDGFDGALLAARLAGRKTAVKVALMDQARVAGVGNIYACEALYRAGLDPRRPAADIKGKKADMLARALRGVMTEALASGGSTLRDHRQIDGSTGYFQHAFAVYGHEGQACGQCTCKGRSCVKTLTQGGRTTFYCPVKQR